jgi:hypothetical protein
LPVAKLITMLGDFGISIGW